MDKKIKKNIYPCILLISWQLHDFFYKRRLIFSSTGHLLFLPIFPVLMSLTCLLFFRWWHSSLVKIHADIRGKNRKKISVSVLSKCDPIWFHYYVVVHDFLQQKVRLSGSSLTSKNFSTEHLLFLPKFPVLNILSLINVSLLKKMGVLRSNETKLGHVC